MLGVEGAAMRGLSERGMAGGGCGAVRNAYGVAGSRLSGSGGGSDKVIDFLYIKKSVG